MIDEEGKGEGVSKRLPKYVSKFYNLPLLFLTKCSCNSECTIKSNKFFFLKKEKNGTKLPIEEFLPVMLCFKKKIASKYTEAPR